MGDTSDSKNVFYTNSSLNALINGLLYKFKALNNIANGSAVTVSFTTGSLPVHVNLFDVLVSGTRDVNISGFVGGTVTGGTQITEIFPLNHYIQGISPYSPNSVYNNRTVSVAGTKFFDNNLGQQDRSSDETQSFSTILAPNTLYYFTITNNDQTADTILSVACSNLA